MPLCKRNILFKQTLAVLLTALFGFVSCSKIYSTGDRYYQKKLYDAALSSYNDALESEHTSADERAVLLYKIARTYYAMGRNETALKKIKEIQAVPSGIECRFLGFKLKLMNEASDFSKESRFIDILERINASKCPVNSKDLDTFYNNLRSLYYPKSIRKGDRPAILGNLKSDLKDPFAALSYYKKALIINPSQEEYLIKTLITLNEILLSIVDKFERQQKYKFYKNDFPLFFEFLSLIYSERDFDLLKTSEKVAQELGVLTERFDEVSTTIPVSVFNSYFTPDKSDLIKTYRVGSSFLVFRIDRGEERSKYIVYSKEDGVIGMTGTLDDDAFIPAR
jgi:tetratricopeptide (TPR) repeat protein